MSINIRSREFPNTLTTMLASPEGMNTAMSLQGDDAVTLVDILDQVSGPTRTIGTSRLTPFTGIRGSEYAARPPEEECSDSPESLRFTGHLTAFLHTLGEHLKGGRHRICFRRIHRCLERPPQWESRVHKSIPSLHRREPVQNQTGLQQVIFTCYARL